MNALRGLFAWARPQTPAEEARKQLAHARLARLEAASMRESWAGFEQTLERRIRRLEGEVEAAERRGGK